MVIIFDDLDNNKMERSKLPGVAYLKFKKKKFVFFSYFICAIKHWSPSTSN